MELHDKNGKLIAKISASGAGGGLEEGVWVEIQAADGTRPTLCLVKGKPHGEADDGWYLGVYRDTKQPGIACDFAISFTKSGGPVLQATKGKEVRSKSLFDLLCD